jgi:hypothetical protein
MAGEEIHGRRMDISRDFFLEKPSATAMHDLASDGRPENLRLSFRNCSANFFHQSFREKFRLRHAVTAGSVLMA